MLLLLFSCKSCYYAHFIIEKTPQNHYVYCCVHTHCDIGVRLSWLLAAVTDGQIVTVPILVAVLLLWVKSVDSA